MRFTYTYALRLTITENKSKKSYGNKILIILIILVNLYYVNVKENDLYDQIYNIYFHVHLFVCVFF